MAWQLQQAKQQFSELVRRALEDGPQVVTRHGREAVVVVSAAEFKTRRAPAADFKRFLRSAPDLARLRPSRDRRRARRVTL
jgi:prevent-host-death family protein